MKPAAFHLLSDLLHYRYNSDSNDLVGLLSHLSLRFSHVPAYSFLQLQNVGFSEILWMQGEENVTLIAILPGGFTSSWLRQEYFKIRCEINKV